MRQAAGGTLVDHVEYLAECLTDRTFLRWVAKFDIPTDRTEVEVGFIHINTVFYGLKRLAVDLGMNLFCVYGKTEHGFAAKRPSIEARVHDSPLPFSTRIIVEFGNDEAVKLCLDDARKRLEYYPCNITIDNKPFSSIWQRARENNAVFFSERSCHGFLEKNHWNRWITVMCKYEYLLRIPVPNLLTGGPDNHNDLRDYYGKEVPYLPKFFISINCNDLSVTISRDSFRMDYNYTRMIRVLADVLMVELCKEIDEEGDAEIILAKARRGAVTGYVPARWRMVMTVIRSIPSFIFTRLGI